MNGIIITEDTFDEPKRQRRKKMKKYYVTIEWEQNGDIFGDYMLKTDDADEAIKQARYFAARTSSKSEKVEIRMYKEDIENDGCTCFDYDTLDFQDEDEEPERIEDIESSAAALYDGGWRAEDRDQMIEEYDLHPDDADEICEKLAEYEENENE